MRRRTDQRLFGGNAAEVGPGKQWWEEDLNLLRGTQGQPCSLHPNRANTSRQAIRCSRRIGERDSPPNGGESKWNSYEIPVVGGGFEPP